MFDLVLSGGTSDNPKAAREPVASERDLFPRRLPSHFVDRPPDEVDECGRKRCDAALVAFHNLVGAWSNPSPPGLCPLP
jgi:hypothetical protein